WREGGRWLELKEVTYHATTQPENNLPIPLHSRTLMRLRKKKKFSILHATTQPENNLPILLYYRHMGSPKANLQSFLAKRRLGEGFQLGAYFSSLASRFNL
ncbi:MAG: hypothetical protein ACK544_10145, partial [Microcystis sp.]